VLKRQLFVMVGYNPNIGRVSECDLLNDLWRLIMLRKIVLIWACSWVGRASSELCVGAIQFFSMSLVVIQIG